MKKMVVNGGKGKMFSKGHAGPQKPNAMSAGGRSKGASFGVKGGTTKMFGKQTAKPACAC